MYNGDSFNSSNMFLYYYAKNILLLVLQVEQ